jgi:hypothetical protein
MVASALPPLSRSTRRTAPSCRGPVARRMARRHALMPAALAALLLLAAVVMAPEQPQDQEAICQRHNGVDACRVW